MTDRISTAARSAVMSSIRSQDTKPELHLRRALWRIGARGYRLENRILPGRPDLVFARPRVAVFVDGCFWHGCPSHCRLPASNAEYWTRKIARNVARDSSTTARLANLGWSVLRVWEHDDPAVAAAKVATAVRSAKHRASDVETC